MNRTIISYAGTYDIIGSSASPDSSGVDISAIFVENSTATGALFNFIFINENNRSVDFSKSYCLALNKSSVSRGLEFPLYLYPGQYMVYTYDIENDKRLPNGTSYEANSNNISVIGGGNKSKV